MKKTLLACFLLACTFMNSQITLGTSGGTNIYSLIDPWYNYSYGQNIISKTELNAESSGTITYLEFKVASTATLANSNDWKIYMGTTTKTSFSSTSDWIPVTSLTEVYNGPISLGPTVGVTKTITVNLTKTFFYNNVDNLVIAIDENKAGSDGTAHRLYAFTSTANTSLIYKSDTANPDPASLPTTGVGFFLTGYRPWMTIGGLTKSTLATNDVAKSKEIVYPNPATTEINLKISEDQKLNVYSFDGKLVRSVDAKKGDNKIDVSTLPKGSYLLKTKDGTQKFIKK